MRIGKERDREEKRKSCSDGRYGQGWEKEARGAAAVRPQEAGLELVEVTDG
jgi:hypothetical protein